MDVQSICALDSCFEVGSVTDPKSLGSGKTMFIYGWNWKKLGCVRSWVTSVRYPKREEAAWPLLF